MFPSLLKDNFTGYKILGWRLFFFQHVKYFTPLLSRLHGFWEEVRFNFIFVLICKVFISTGIFQDFKNLSLIFCSLKMIFLDVVFCYLSCLVFSEFPRFVVWYLTLIGGKVSVIIVSSIFFLFLSLFVLLLICPLHVCYTICSCPTVPGYSFLFFSAFVLFAFQFSRILLLYPTAQKFFPQPCQAHQRHPWFLSVFFKSPIFLYSSFLGFPPLCLHCLSVLACFLLYPLEPLAY